MSLPRRTSPLAWPCVILLALGGTMLRGGTIVCSDSSGEVRLELRCERGTGGDCDPAGGLLAASDLQHPDAPGPCEDEPLDLELAREPDGSRQLDLPLVGGSSTIALMAVRELEPRVVVALGASARPCRPPDALRRLRCVVLTV